MSKKNQILIVHANDADQHLGYLISIAQRLQEEGRITSFSALSILNLNTTSFESVNPEDQVIFLLSVGVKEHKNVIEQQLLHKKAQYPDIKLMEVLVDSMVPNEAFTIIPQDLEPLRMKKDMDLVWKTIETHLRNQFPKSEMVAPVKWKKYIPHLIGVVSLIVLFIVLFDPIPRNVNMQNFTKKFGFDKKTEAWLNATTATKQKLVAFYQKNETRRAKEFTEFAVEVLVNEGHVDIDEVYIETEVGDVLYEAVGGKGYLPNPELIKPPQKVIINFGTTASDGVHANQQVSNTLVQGLIHAVEKANKNLPKPKRIKSIYVMATTNGKHGPNSNHYSGSALDVSRINGVKMVLMTDSQLEAVEELQKAFNSYSYVRENFGPKLKTKYLIEKDQWQNNYDVPGHMDHIHFSTRKLDGELAFSE